MSLLSLPLKADYTCIGLGRNMDHPQKEGGKSPIEIPDSWRCGHVLVTGSTRSGKSRLAENLIEQDIRKGYSLLIIDPKIDQQLSNKVIQVACSTSRQDDLMFITPLFPELSSTLNPLSHWFTSEEIVAHVISGLEQTKEPFFRHVAKNITSSVIEGLNLLAQFQGKSRANFTFQMIADYSTRQGLQGLLAELSYLTVSPSVEKLIKQIEQTLATGDEYFGKTSMSLQNVLNDLTNGNVGHLLSQGFENKFLNRMEKDKGVILVCQTGNLVIGEAAQTLAKVILSMTLKYVGRVMASARKKMIIPLCVHLDEAQSLLFPGFDEAYSKVGASNTWITSYIQDSAQVRAKMGPDTAQAILANHNTKIFLRTPDNMSAEFISGHFGTHKVASPIFSHGAITTREIEELIVKPFDLMSLQQRDFYMITYSSEFSRRGRYCGRTYDNSLTWMDIKYPSTPSTQIG